MLHFTPTLGTKETGRNVKNFVKEHHNIFIELLKPLLAPVIALLVLDLVVTELYFPTSEDGFQLGSVLSGYFFTALIISWHRVVLDGPDRFVPVNPYKPKKHELVFMGVGILLILSIVVFAGLMGFIGAMLGKAGLAVAVVIAVGMSVYISYRYSFYFPAKAIDQSITLKQAYALSKGYFWKMMGSTFLASLKTLLLYILYLVVLIVLVTISAYFLAESEENPGISFNSLVFILTLPAHLYFSPLIGLFGVTALSNYYQWAINNPPARTA